MKTVYPFGRLSLGFVKPQMVLDMDSPNDQHVPILLDLSPGLGNKLPLAGRYPARFQRAPKGSGQSAGGRSHQVIERRGLWFVDRGIHAVMFGNLGVYAKENRILLGRQIRTA